MRNNQTNSAPIGANFNTRPQRTPQPLEAETSPPPLKSGAPPETELEWAFNELAHRSRRIANAIEATTRRRDVRDKRSKIVLAIYRHRCPLDGTPRLPWYVPGATARHGAEGLRRDWKRLWGEDPPSLRTVRSHLGALEMACCIIRSPGDFLPMMRNPEHPEHRPRHPDTLHIIEGDAAAHWWSTVGRARIETSPDCRSHPTRWRLLFSNWRTEAAAADAQGEHFDPEAELLEALPEPARAVMPTTKRVKGLPNRPPVASAESLTAAASLRSVVRRRESTPTELHQALRRVGADVAGKMAWAVAASPDRFRGAAALLVLAIERGDRIRNPAGWLVRAFKLAPDLEQDQALDRVMRTPSAP